MTLNRQPLSPGQTFQQEDREPYHVCFCGATGTGKTTLAIQKFLAEPHPWKIVFDPERQWAKRISKFTGQECRALSRLDQICLALEHSGSACVDLTPVLGSNKRFQAEWLLNWLWVFAGSFRGEKLIMFDDFPDYLPKNDEKFLQHIASEVAGAGRRRGIDYYAICRTVSEASSVFRSSMTEVFAFQQMAGRKADALEDEWGFDSAALMALKPGDYLHLDCRQQKRTAGRVKLGSA